MISLKSKKIINDSYAYDNVLNHNKDDFNGQSKVFIKIKSDGPVYPSVAVKDMEKGCLGFSGPLRTKLNIALNETIYVLECKPVNAFISDIDISLNSKDRGVTILHEDEVRDKIRNIFNGYYFSNGQVLIMTYNDKTLMLNVSTKKEGYLNKDTKINISSNDVSLNFMSSKLLKRDLFRDDYNFEEIGIGGLNKELLNAFRRALSTRAYKASTAEKLGIKHIKGILLYGPPGTGKTLIARKIGAMISNREPKLVNGPEIMNKFVGQSEENIRNLFADAKSDYDKNKDNADLHVIIFDEIDAICRTRGRSGVQSSVTDSIVNQLLSMIQGVNELNNIFIIAMTNRKDLLDEALIRAGRIEVHIEIGLPNREGRQQIFRIHTNKMKTNNMMDKNVDIMILSEMTDNYSGAEIEAVVKNAASRALQEQLSSDKKDIKDEDIVVNMNHFIKAIDEVQPSFGNINKIVMSLLPSKYAHLSDEHKLCYDGITTFMKKNRKLKTILITGENGTGKTTLATKIAFDNLIKYTKIIRAIDMVSFDETMKTYFIVDTVTNAYISEESLVILDDIEIAMNYAKMGHSITFSNKLYQSIITLLKSEPTMSNHKLTLIVTCSDNEFAEMISKCFDMVFNIGKIKHKEIFNVTNNLGYNEKDMVLFNNDDITIRELLNSV
ncbi:AAA ATPase protein [Fadolivirus algeromassiliense]|jgi:vesicle-fusing ATPase|uniref:AAA ATPase protein n=1 Tax=Fadolivirus FV1/VV64 TaxID=3070911 RepID=A0A7D3UTL3_9VIRU|nr:AAA ATPase protein [Fadolivirus algeromassiliense]QKF94390.1 AAA ATPase protein [Fadolivirus FV1/VV64]